jgi:hypothetical protein
MKSGFRTLAMAILALSFASGADAKGSHPCRQEHLAAKAACGKDKHSADCKAARKAKKQCRIANGLPVKGKGGTVAPPAAPATSSPAAAAPDAK